MAIFLANEDVEQLISMRDCIDSVERAYRELGMQRACGTLLTNWTNGIRDRNPRRRYAETCEAR